jgi:Terminase large subunit, T4likevirus-type, N-terminal/Terminase RNaseH-like domain
MPTPDVAAFAQELIGEPLWPHQLEVLRCPARVRAINSGRQAGKTRTLAVAGLYDAFSGPDRRILILSAGEEASKDVVAEIARLASSPYLSGSMIDESKAQITLSNGSTIRSVPASEKRVRGQAIDLLILDEACYIGDELWTAARFTIIARPGSKVIMASTPWGRADRFFAVSFRAGQRGEDGYASFHWPSTISPLVDSSLLDLWRRTSTEREFRREVEAEWLDDSGAYFSSAELEGALGDYDLVPPDEAEGITAVGGIDWGFSADANAIALLSLDPDDGIFWIPWIEERFRTSYAVFIDRIAEIDQGYDLTRVVSEMNGVGAMPTQVLTARLKTRVVGFHTDARSKEDGYGTIKTLIGQGRLHLPRHPALLGQLAALEFEQRDGGTTHISVPERMGHDDLAMSLCLAVQGEPELLGPKRRRLRYRGQGTEPEPWLVVPTAVGHS